MDINSYSGDLKKLMESKLGQDPSSGIQYLERWNGTVILCDTIEI